MTAALPGAGLGVGVVGGGFMAQVHARSARLAGARLVGLSSSSPESAARAAQQLGFDRGHASLEDLLADESIDVVHVCTPNALHAEQAAAVLASGRDVVCEKPLATTVADAAALVEQAAGAGRTATVPFVYRFHPLVREARDRVARGDTGRMLTVAASYLQDWLLTADDDNWRVDADLGGASRAFADIGSHLVDLVEFVTGDRIVRIAGRTRTFVADRAQHRGVTNEDAAALVVETAGGAVGTLLVSQVAPGRKNRLHLEVAGAAESLAFDQEHPETLWLGRREGSVLLPRDAAQNSDAANRYSVVPSGHPQGYPDAFAAFVADSYAAARGEDPDGLPRFADGLRAAVVTESVLRAAATDGWVDVPA
ncbi:Gfo/Idh/MocA family protein [Actinotalea caeni]|uniref:Gfo/Idh/MocA family protein n=1 Tax=Actinotalea caeni TaxID=1348467 RepID=UPI0023DB2F96|nr:Gfo/Idh/MocA family oxidoreductase [Actinotalea caeni]